MSFLGNRKARGPGDDQCRMPENLISNYHRLRIQISRRFLVFSIGPREGCSVLYNCVPYNLTQERV